MIKQLKKIWTHSIQRQLIISIALIHAVLMTIFVFDLVHRQRVFLEKQSQNHSLGLCKTIATNSVSWVLAQDLVGMEEIILSQSQHPDLLYAMLISPQGKVMAHTKETNIGLFISDSLSLSLLKKETIPQILVNNSSIIDVASPIFANEKFIGWARVGMSQQIIHDSLIRITKDGIWYAILAIIVGSIFAIIVGRSITLGLRHLVKVANEISDGNENARITFKRSDELGNLGKNLNLMIDSIIKQKNIISKTQKKLKDSEQKLKIQNEELDKKVEERTRKLTESETKLKELNATKDKLFSIIAHDLRAPFNSLIGFSDLLIEKTSQSTDKELREYSSIINESLNKTFNYLNNLLEWSRLQTNRIEFNPSTFSLSDLVEEVKEILIAQAQNKEIHIKLSLQSKVEFFADRNMIKIVLINLVSNAIKYSNVGSEITISSKRSNKQDKVFIEDNGVGISKEICQQLFKVEESFSTPGTNNEKGTGLGLVLCNDFVKKHNGQIDVKSEIGKGSVFCISLPYNERKE